MTKAKDQGSKASPMARALGAKKSAEDPRSASEQFDDRKRQMLMRQSEAEAQLRPDDTSALRGAAAAMTLDECYKSFRQALRVLQAAIDKKLKPGERGYVARAEERVKALRTLKTLVDEEIAADATAITETMQKLLEECRRTIGEASRR